MEIEFNFESDYPEKQKAFVGRDEFLNKINQLFSSNQLIAIIAFGGTGKSTLALEYCHRLKECEQNTTTIIRWLNAASSDQFEDDFKKLAELLNINIENAKLDFIIRKVYSKLEELNKNFLFVFDNVEGYDDIKEYIKVLPSNLKILMTTRDNLDQTQIDKIELEPFSLNEAEDYIHTNIDSKVKPNQAEMNKIIDLSKSTENEILPIKIELIVSYLNTFIGEKTIEKCLNDITKNEYLIDRVEAKLFNFLKLENELSFKLLRICAFLNPDYVEKKLLFKLYEELFRIKIQKQEKFNKAFLLLNKLSLVSKRTRNKIDGIKTHRLIQEEMLSYTENEEKYDEEFEKNVNFLTNIIKYIDSRLEYEVDDPKTWKKVEEIYLQSKNIIKVVSDEKIKVNPNQNKPFYEFADNVLEFELFTRKIKQDSVKTIKIIQLELSLNTDASSVLSNTLNNVGLAYDDLNNYEKALEYKLKALEMDEKLFSSDHPDLASSLSSVGSSYEDLNQHEKALEFKLKALEMRQRLYATDHSDIATSLNNIGTSYLKLNDYEKALEYSTKSLEMKQRLYDSDHADLSTSFNNIGCIYRELEDYDKALEFQLKALEMDERLFDSDHPSLAISLNNVGSAYRNLEDHQKALEYQLKALDMQQRLFDWNHPDLAATLVAVGLSYSNLSDYSRALEYHLKAFGMMQAFFKSDHADLATCLYNIGEVYGDLSEHERALEYQIEALNMRQRLFSSDHPDLAASLSSVGSSYDDLNQHEKALEYKLKGLEMRQRLYATDHSDIATSLNNIGTSYHHLNDNQKALEYFLKALEMDERLCGDFDDSDLATSLANVGLAYEKLNDDKKALEYLRKALEMEKRLKNVDDVNLLTS